MKIKLSILIIFIPIIVFLTWMNLTPGHFQYGSCGCTVKYTLDDKKPRCAIGCLPGNDIEEFIDFVKIKMAILDLNK